MSKAFASEETADDPIVVRPRAPLPPGVPNYTTPRGLELLRNELAALDAAREALVGGAAGASPAADPGDRRARLQALATRHLELTQRIGSAVVVPAAGAVPDEVRFGTEVEVEDERGETRRYRIVGVDEANAREGRLAFVSPLARALLGRRPGEQAAVPTPRGEETLTILALRP